MLALTESPPATLARDADLAPTVARAVPATWSPLERTQFVEIARRCAVERCASYTLVAIGLQSFFAAESTASAVPTLTDLGRALDGAPSACAAPHEDARAR